MVGFASIEPTSSEIHAARPGDDIVRDAQVVMDRAFDLPASVEHAWPWFVQLGKQRAGWYLPRSVERFVPRSRRALRRLDPQLQHLAVGDVIPDWGGADETFEVAELDAPHTLVHRSTRRAVLVSWSITLHETGPGSCRAHLRLRLGGVRRVRLAETFGGAVDALTVAGLAAGLRERLAGTSRP